MLILGSGSNLIRSADEAVFSILPQQGDEHVEGQRSQSQLIQGSNVRFWPKADLEFAPFSLI